MTSTVHSFLDGREWVLRTRVLRSGGNGVTLTHDAAIRATIDSRADWNANFWQHFAEDAGEFRALVLRGDVNVRVMFRFRPTARMKQQYGNQPVLKVARTAEGWRGSLEKLPTPLAAAIEDYERDKRMLDQQRQQAWFDLLHLRLPTPPVGYRWELTSGDPRFYGDLLNFQLKQKV